MMMLSSLAMTILVLVLQVSQSFITLRNFEAHMSKVYNQMPNLTPDEMEALNRMMEQNRDSFPSYFKRRPPSGSTSKVASSAKPSAPVSKPLAATNAPKTASKPSVTSSKVVAAPSTEKKSVVRPLYEPNADWRHAIENPYRGVKKDMPKPKKMDPEDDLLEFDYDDLSAAMYEEASGAYSSYADIPRGKYSEAPEQHDGLYSGEVIKRSAWSKLVNHLGNATTFQQIHRNQVDVVVVYVDPHRLSDEFSSIVGQLDKLPRKALKVATVAVSFDEPNQLRKLLKKNNYVTPVLCDLSRTVSTLVIHPNGKTNFSLLYIVWEYHEMSRGRTIRIHNCLDQR